MAWYAELTNIHLTGKPGNSWWTHYYGPSQDVPVSGIYKCRHCKREVTCNFGDIFPPQNHHQHPSSLGEISWELIVRTNTSGD